MRDIPSGLGQDTRTVTRPQSEPATRVSLSVLQFQPLTFHASKALMSNAIDRGGSSATLDTGSTFTLVDPIPRGAAWQWDWMRADWIFNGGRPRCPRCLKSNAVAFNGYHKPPIAGQFHCNRCRTCWHDIAKALCYICDEPFAIRPERRYHGMPHGTCYHINRIQEPFCPRCAATIGTDRKHGRRQLRRMVGLR